MPDTFDSLMQEAAINDANSIRGGRVYSHIIAGDRPNLNVTREEVQDQGGNTIRPATAGTVSLVSTSANDTLAGTGCRQVFLRGVGEGFAPGADDYPWVEETVDMDGLTPVVSNLPFFRLTQIICMTSGSVNGNDGTITASIAGNIQLQMSVIDSVGNGISRSTHVAVPMGYTGYIKDFLVMWGGNQPVQVNCSGTIGNTVFYVVSGRFESTRLASLHTAGFPGGSETWCEAARIGGGGTDPINISSRLLVLRNAGATPWATRRPPG